MYIALFGGHFRLRSSGPVHQDRQKGALGAVPTCWPASSQSRIDIQGYPACSRSTSFPVVGPASAVHFGGSIPPAELRTSTEYRVLTVLHAKYDTAVTYIRDTCSLLGTAASRPPRSHLRCLRFAKTVGVAPIHGLQLVSLRAICAEEKNNKQPGDAQYVNRSQLHCVALGEGEREGESASGGPSRAARIGGRRKRGTACLILQYQPANPIQSFSARLPSEPASGR